MCITQLNMSAQHNALGINLCVLLLHVYATLTFRGPGIVIFSSNKSQLFLKFILVKNSTCFRQIYCPQSGVLILYTQQ